MSEYLEFSWTVNGIKTAATSVVLSDPTGTFGAKRTDTGEVVIEDGQAMVLGLDNVYRYPIPAGLESTPLTWVAEVVYNDRTYRYEFDTTGEPVTADIGVPVFEHVSVIMDTGRAALRVATVEGLSTKHGSMLSDRGRLHATVDKPDSNYRVRVYADIGRTRQVMLGTSTTLGDRFALAAVNGSGMSGYAVLDGYSISATAVLIPTFAVDADVMVEPAAAAALPGYNDTYGLAFIHAQQHRVLLLTELPAAVPHLYTAGALAGFVPDSDGTPALPAIDKIANIDALRVAQAMLVKAAAAEQDEHIEEWAAIAAKSRGRFDAMMKKIMAGNPNPADVADDAAETISTSTWNRG